MPNPDDVIERLTSDSYGELLEIWESSVRATHLFLSEENIAFYKPIVLKYALPDVSLYGIRAKQDILGFMGTSENKVEMLFLRPDCRGRGLGRKLLSFALNELKIRKVDVNEENLNALGFYLHLGYQVVSRDELDGNGKPHPILHLEHAPS